MGMRRWHRQTAHRVHSFVTNTSAAARRGSRASRAPMGRGAGASDRYRTERRGRQRPAMSNAFSARGWTFGRSNHQLLKGIASGSAIYSPCCSRQPSRGISSDRTAGHGPGKKIVWVEGQQRYAAGRRDHGHRMGNVVDFMSRNDTQAGPLQVVLDHKARSRGRLRRDKAGPSSTG